MTLEVVQFSMSVAGITVAGTVPTSYFESTVRPVMDEILGRLRNSPASPGKAAIQEPAQNSAGPEGRLDLSVKTICQRLGAKTGTDLLKAGAVSLALVQGQSQFTRKEILAEAHKAAGYWKASYSKDAGRYTTTLQSQKFLIEGASGQLTLSAKAETDMIELLTRES